MTAWPLLWLLAAAPPDRALFLFELRGTPAGTVELSWSRETGRYMYRSTHLFTRGTDRSRLARHEELAVGPDGRLAGGAWPSALWLWRPPSPGCVPGREELTGRTGKLCAESVEEGMVRGTLFGAPFQATFASGWLRTLSLGDARFTAVPEGTQVPWPPDLIGAGVPVAPGKGALALEPALPQPRPALRPGWSEAEARALAREVHGAITDKRPSAADFSGEDGEGAGGCLAHARRFARRAREQGRDAAIVHGLLASPGERRAYPHVWVRVALVSGGTLDLDPTSLEEVAPGTHAPLAVEGAGESPGAAFLKLFSGQLRVVRR